MTALLLNLSYVGTQTRESILRLLLAGARQLGNVVREVSNNIEKNMRGILSNQNVLYLKNHFIIMLKEMEKSLI